uniref:Threonine synthase N-terminal domain-containing protein n=1 Tax=Arion vulgaris TaxID=1028688 RepID=A0A0B6ZH84_9EUPU
MFTALRTIPITLLWKSSNCHVKWLHVSCCNLHEKVPKIWSTWDSLNGKENIVLMGNPGSGKTTTGKLVATTLGLNSVDIDDNHLEPTWGMSVAAKLKQVGPKRFVEEEGRALLDLNIQNSVISLSGSNPLHSDSMAKIAQSGILVYLDANNGTIIKRQKVMKVDRIIGMESGASLEEILQFRRQFYEKWYDIRVAVHEDDKADNVAEKVLKAISRFQKDRGYVSTRAAKKTKSASFLETVLQGLADDGGLYVKAGERPTFSLEDLNVLVPLNYRERAQRLLEAWIHPLDISPQELNSFISKSYTDGLFEHSDIAPVVHLEENIYTQELFHGPTASFKDFALQLMPRFFTKAMKQRGPDVKYLILAATSGDTGSATLDGFSRHASGAKVGVVVLYPHKNISTIQKHQTVTVEGSNVKVIGVDGDFDFCQHTVKKIFVDQKIREILGACRLSAANSINWGRILPQILYHATAYLNLVHKGHIALGDPIDLCVPTGNFGNILSAYYVKEMGFPIRKLICASNSNNILTDFIHTGQYSPSSYTLKSTISPSIDIITSSNLERLLYHLSGEDPQMVVDFYRTISHNGKAHVPQKVKDALQENFLAAFATEENTNKTIMDVFVKTGYLIDPHTAVGYYVAKNFGNPKIPTVVAGTAHYGKFVDNILPLLKTSEDKPSYSVGELMDQASNLTSTPVMNKLLTAMVTKKVVHTDTVSANYDQISQMVIEFAKTL